MIMPVTEKTMLYVLKELAVSLMLFAVTVIAIIVFLIGISNVLKDEAKAEVKPTAHGCQVWFSRTATSSSQVEIWALSDAATGPDRLATAVELVKKLRLLTGAQFVEVSLFGVGTIPYKPHLNGNTTTAYASFSRNNNEWVGMYATDPTSGDLTAERGAEGNPFLNIEFVNDKDVKNLKYRIVDKKCDLSMVLKYKRFAHSNLESFTPPDSVFYPKLKVAAIKFLETGL